MMDNTQNYWVFELLPSSRILGNGKCDVSETGNGNVVFSIS
jgi:hypothetical protein